MNKVIRSQDGMQLHYTHVGIPCYFSVSPVPVGDDAGGVEPALYSVGVNNISFGVYKKLATAKAILAKLEGFLLNKTARFHFPTDQ